MKKLLRNSLVLSGAMLLLSGCALREIYEEIRLAETIGTIRGRVELSGIRNGPVVVRLYSLEDGVYVYKNYTTASSAGEYLFYVGPGTYYIAAFIDRNADNEYEAGEDGNYYGSISGKPAAISVAPGQTVVVETITITGELPLADVDAPTRVDLVPAKNNLGRVITLDDVMFSGENYSMGMWKPVRFLLEVGGGLFFLQEYEDDKIPVLFIHGINGGPADWRVTAGALDERYFQPWVLYYPSGLRLDMVSNYLVWAIAELHQKYRFRQLYVVAHSMGGLVAWSFVKKYLEMHPEDAGVIRLVMTINSPMDGLEIAVRGVQNSPIVVPAWHDLAQGSDFLKDLYTWPWPDTVPYHLVFSYTTDSSGDGVVPLESQIPLKLQSEAVRIYGFNSSHAGILSDEAFLDRFSMILNASRASYQRH